MAYHLTFVWGVTSSCSDCKECCLGMWCCVFGRHLTTFGGVTCSLLLRSSADECSASCTFCSGLNFWQSVLHSIPEDGILQELFVFLLFVQGHIIPLFPAFNQNSFRLWWNDVVYYPLHVRLSPQMTNWWICVIGGFAKINVHKASRFC